MCMSTSETQRSSSTTKPTGSGNHQQQQQQTPPLRGLSPRSVMSRNENNNSGSSSSSSSSSSRHDRILLLQSNHNHHDSSDTATLGREERDDPSSSSCWNHGMMRWRRRGRASEPRDTTTPIIPNKTSVDAPVVEMSTTPTTVVTSSSLCDFLPILPTVLASVIVTMGMIQFAVQLPFVLVPAAAIPTYVWAHYQYRMSESQFDNTIWTYGTDYCLAYCMMYLIRIIPYQQQQQQQQQQQNNKSPNEKHRVTTTTTTASFDTTAYYTRGLLGSYMISVLAGGVAHQTFTTVQDQNTIAFRCVWTICVGAVAMASAFMGAAATSLYQYDRSILSTTSPHQKTVWSVSQYVPLIPVSFWYLYALGITTFVMIGGFSFQRPACDIFVVGITQFPSTFYMMLVLYTFGGRNCSSSSSSKSVSTDAVSTSGDNELVVPSVVLSNRMKTLACCGFILNAPLLPLYPILVQYTNWSLGGINTLLHTWLLVAWTCQGMSLRHIGLQSLMKPQPHQQQVPEQERKQSSSSSLQ